MVMIAVSGAGRATRCSDYATAVPSVERFWYVGHHRRTAGDARRILDLGTGDGRLLALLQIDRPNMLGVGLDFSEIMLKAARKRFAGDERIELVKHDFAEPLPALGRFDVVVSSMAIHHLEHERKRSLYGEVFDLLEPGGVVANLEHVASATQRLHMAFFAAINEPLEHEDPSDRVLDLETQLRWLREHGFDDVDCYWKCLEMALLVGVSPTHCGNRPLAKHHRAPPAAVLSRVPSSPSACFA